MKYGKEEKTFINGKIEEDEKNEKDINKEKEENGDENEHDG
jgi:hypothetical protein